MVKQHSEAFHIVICVPFLTFKTKITDATFRQHWHISKSHKSFGRAIPPPPVLLPMRLAASPALPCPEGGCHTFWYPRGPMGSHLYQLWACYSCGLTSSARCPAPPAGGCHMLVACPVQAAAPGDAARRRQGLRVPEQRKHQVPATWVTRGLGGG